MSVVGSAGGLGGGAGGGDDKHLYKPPLPKDIVTVLGTLKEMVKLLMKNPKTGSNLPGTKKEKMRKWAENLLSYVPSESTKAKQKQTDYPAIHLKTARTLLDLIYDIDGFGNRHNFLIDVIMNLISELHQEMEDEDSDEEFFIESKGPSGCPH